MFGAWAVAAIIGLGIGIGLLILRVPLHRPPRLSTLVDRARELRTHLAGQQLIGIGGALLPYVLSVIVTVRLSATDNAFFYTTWMMAGIFLIIAPAVSLSLFAEGAHDPRDLRVKARSALLTIAAILIPGTIVVLATGGIFLSVLGPAYEHPPRDSLQIVLIASFPDAITNVYSFFFFFFFLCVPGRHHQRVCRRPSCPRAAHGRRGTEPGYGNRNRGPVLGAPASPWDHRGGVGIPRDAACRLRVRDRRPHPTSSLGTDDGADETRGGGLLRTAISVTRAASSCAFWRSSCCRDVADDLRPTRWRW